MQPDPCVSSTPSNVITLERGAVRARIAPDKGGRILELSYEAVNALHNLYPEGYNFGPYTEYGGIEEHVGGAPGALWGVPWDAQTEGERITLSAWSNQTLVQKTISLVGDPILLRVEYELSNYSASFARFTFGIHPELTLGGDHRSLKYAVTLAEGLEEGRYTEAGFRKSLTPSEGWSALTYNDRLFAQMLPPGVMDRLEIYIPKVDTHLVLQPVVYGVGLSPGKATRFTYLAYHGPGDVATARELYAESLPKLTQEYGAAKPQSAMPALPPHNTPHDNHFGMDANAAGQEGHPGHRDARHAAREMLRTMEREQRKFEREQRKFAREQRHMERAARRGQFPFNPPPIPPMPDVPPVPSTPFMPPIPPIPQFAPPPPEPDARGQRLRVLRDIAEGRIAVDDAARLLKKLAV